MFTTGMQIMMMIKWFLRNKWIDEYIKILALKILSGNVSLSQFIDYVTILKMIHESSNCWFWIWCSSSSNTHNKIIHIWLNHLLLNLWQETCFSSEFSIPLALVENTLLLQLVYASMFLCSGLTSDSVLRDHYWWCSGTNGSESHWRFWASNWDWLQCKTL